MRHREVFCGGKWGTGSLSGSIFQGTPPRLAASPQAPSTRPLALNPTNQTRAQQADDEFGQAIAADEIGSEVSSFTSKFDAFFAGSATLTASESHGYDLFRGKANLMRRPGLRTRRS